MGKVEKLLKKTTKRGLAETGMKYFPGRHRTTAANSGTMQYHATVEGPQNWALVWGPGSRAPESKVLEKFQYHATVEGPQNWALVWGPGSRAPESKVLEKFQYHATVEEHLRTEQQSWVPSANAGG